MEPPRCRLDGLLLASLQRRRPHESALRPRQGALLATSLHQPHPQHHRALPRHHRLGHLQGRVQLRHLSRSSRQADYRSPSTGAAPRRDEIPFGDPSLGSRSSPGSSQPMGLARAEQRRAVRFRGLRIAGEPSSSSASITALSIRLRRKSTPAWSASKPSNAGTTTIGLRSIRNCAPRSSKAFPFSSASSTPPTLPASSARRNPTINPRRLPARTAPSQPPRRSPLCNLFLPSCR